MVLTNTPFNGSNFLRCSHTVKMALGAKLKLGFINGTCVRAGIFDDGEGFTDGGLDVTIWSLVGYWNSMTAELSGSISIAQSALESVRNQILSMDPLPNVNKAYYIVQQVEKQKQVKNHVADPMAFFANMNQNKFVKRDNRGKGELKQDVRGFRHCTGCGQDGHSVEQCFEKIGYPDWYKGKNNKKGGKLAANMEVMKMMKGKSSASTSGTTPGYKVAPGFMHHA
ncbi:retrovirus-related pol polyprotein from transposon TNT 1-94, partial [Tanacetum coccineum]